MPATPCQGHSEGREVIRGTGGPAGGSDKSVGDGRDLLLRLPPPWSTHLLVQGPCYTQGQRTDLLGKVGPRAKAVSDSKGGHCLSRPEEGFRHRMSPEGHSGLTAAKEWAGSDPTPSMDKETEA